jgi:hypothetical protein
MCPVDDLIAFLKARLDELQEKADACEAEVGRVRAGEPYDDGSGTADQDQFPSYPWGSEEAELAYLAAVHPRFVLAVVASKREIIAEHTCQCPDPDCGDCGACSGDHHADPTPSPCRTLRLVCVPFADHPAYRESWKP